MSWASDVASVGVRVGGDRHSSAGPAGPPEVHVTTSDVEVDLARMSLRLWASRLRRGCPPRVPCQYLVLAAELDVRQDPQAAVVFVDGAAEDAVWDCGSNDGL